MDFDRLEKFTNSDINTLYDELIDEPYKDILTYCQCNWRTSPFCTAGHSSVCFGFMGVSSAAACYSTCVSRCGAGTTANFTSSVSSEYSYCTSTGGTGCYSNIYRRVVSACNSSVFR